MLHFAKWKIILVLAVSAFGVLFAVPNLLPARTLDALPDWLPHKQINLGLDLQGGSHLLLEVDLNELIESRVKALVAEVRASLREGRIGYQDLRAGDRKVTVRIRNAEDVDKAVRQLRSLIVPVTSSLLGAGSGANNLEISSGQGNVITLDLTAAALDARVRQAVEQSIEIVRRRVDELGTTEPSIQRQGQDRILVQVPGLQDPQRLKELLGTTAKLVFRLVDVSTTAQQALESRVPAGSEILYSEDGTNTPYLVEDEVMVGGEDLVDAQPGFDQRTNEPIVSFRFNTSGAKRFGLVTQRNVGRPFAIVLDNAVVSAPVIREPILGGSGQISGNFTVEEVNDLSILLRAGALPAKLTIIEERTVGPGLGADSIAAGKVAAVIGTVAVVVFILISYGLFGVFANLALAINLGMILGVMSLLQATLTLPGIAGIVLTVGMAVDANVLIFERIREELRSGKTPIAGIEAGYSRALGTILDANITTFLAAAILFQLGSGPVRGFAVTLAIGIVTSVFTAFTLTRLMVSYWVRRTRPSTVPI